jgi:hypothetical protein
MKSAYRLLNSLAKAFGWTFVVEKEQEPAIEMALLGVLFATEPSLQMGLTDMKREIYAGKIDKAKEADHLSPPEAQSLFSTCIWSAALFDNPTTLRRHLAVLKKRAFSKDKDCSISSDMAEALNHLKEVFLSAKSRSIPTLAHEGSSDDIVGEHYCVWTDAMQEVKPAKRYFEDESLRMGTGGVMMPPKSLKSENLAFAARVDPQTIQEWADRETQIHNAELEAVKQGLQTFGPHIDKDFPILWFVDNAGAFGNLCWGDAKCEDSRRLIKDIFDLIQKFNLRIWWEWVESSANCSDVPSRELDFKSELSEVLGGVPIRVIQRAK